MENIQNTLDEILALLKLQNLSQKHLFTLEEAAIYLGQSKSSLYKITHNKVIPHFIPGGKKIYFKKEDLDSWILKSRIESDLELEEEVDQYLTKKPH